MAEFVACPECGGPWQVRTEWFDGEARRVRDRVTDPLYIRPNGLCEDCYLASLVPRWYPREENYFSGRATRKPRTGLDILDCPSGLAASERVLFAKKR